VQRPDPHIIRQLSVRLIVGCVAGISLAVSLPDGARSQSPTDDLKQVQKKIIDARKKQESLDLQQDLLNLEIQNLKKKLVSAANRISSTDTNLTELEDRLEGLRQIEKNTLDSLELRHQELTSTLSALIRLNQRPNAALLGSPANLMDSLRAAKIMQKLIPHLKNESNELAEQLQTLANLRLQYQEERTAFLNLKENRAGEQLQIDLLLKSKQNIERRIQKDHKTQTAKIALLGKQARNLSNLVEKLVVEKKRQQEIDLQNAKARQQKRAADVIKLRPPKAKPAITAPELVKKPGLNKQQLAAVQQNLKSNRRFSSVKGTLPLPVSGIIVARYGKSAESGRKKGIIIETRSQAAVTSPFDGQIAFAGPFRHYGLLLIIDHGEGYHTLLAGMKQINGTVGQHLLAGEPVGQMDINETQKPTLYMELRRKGSPINPHPWLAAGNGKVSG
jgi:murein hydrolase activator